MKSSIDYVNRQRDMSKRKKVMGLGRNIAFPFALRFAEDHNA